MPSKDDDELKLKIFGLLEAKVEPKDIREKLGIPYSKILKYRKEYNAAKDSGDVHTLVDVDKLIVHRVAEEVKGELVDLGSNEDALDTLVGDLTNDIDGYQLLNAKLQTTALKLVSKISSTSDVVHSAEDIQKLVSSLAQIQTAFFSKPTTNVNVLNQQNNYSDNNVSKFKDAKRA